MRSYGEIEAPSNAPEGPVVCAACEQLQQPDEDWNCSSCGTHCRFGFEWGTCEKCGAECGWVRSLHEERSLCLCRPPQEINEELACEFFLDWMKLKKAFGPIIERNQIPSQISPRIVSQDEWGSMGRLDRLELISGHNRRELRADLSGQFDLFLRTRSLDSFLPSSAWWPLFVDALERNKMSNLDQDELRDWCEKRVGERVKTPGQLLRGLESGIESYRGYLSRGETVRSPIGLIFKAMKEAR